MKQQLCVTDIELLRSLADPGGAPRPAHRYFRLELLGLVKEGPDGVRLTEAGRLAAQGEASIEQEKPPVPTNRDLERDALGRRKATTRKVGIL